MNNKHKILEWFSNNIDIVDEISNKYYNEYLYYKLGFDNVFSDHLRSEYYGLFYDYICEECSFALGLADQECKDILGDKLSKMWEIAIKGK